MPWFYCDDCGDTIKKPKVAQHCNQCRASSFTCIDCSLNFDRRTVQGHTQCVTEHEKYALGATKPGGIHCSGFSAEGSAKPGEEGKPEGLNFLTTQPPWKCTICNVNCTSQDTLMGHASGAKHKRRAKAALAAKNGEQQQQQQTTAGQQQEQQQQGASDAEAKPAPTEAAQQREEGEVKKSKKEGKKEKKRKAVAEDVATEVEEGKVKKVKKEKRQKKKKSEDRKTAADVKEDVGGLAAGAENGNGKKKKQKKDKSKKDAEAENGSAKEETAGKKGEKKKGLKA